MTPNWPFPQPGQPMRDDPPPPIRQPQQRAKPQPRRTPELPEAPF